MPGETFLRLVNEGGQRSRSLTGNVAARLASTRTVHREEAVS
jgi:hypothetical protein